MEQQEKSAQFDSAETIGACCKRLARSRVSAPPKNDPRIYFAAERTFLAWSRTGITLLAFGLVVVRFGLIQEWMEKDTAPTTNLHSLVVGGALWLTALVMQPVSLRQFLVYRATLPADQVPPGASSVLPWVLTLVLTAVCGGLLFLVA